MSRFGIHLGVLLAIPVLLAPAVARGAGLEVRPVEKPRAVILLDVSFSVIMSLEKRNPAERAAGLLCEHLGGVVLIPFSDNAQVEPQATGDFRRQEIQAALHPAVAPGLFADYIVGLEATAGVDPTIPVILVTIGEVPERRKRVIDYYRNRGRLVHVLGVERHPDEREFMGELAAATGGRYFAAKNVMDLIRLFTDVPPGLRVVAGKGPLAAGLSHPIRVEFTELGDPLEEGLFVHYGVHRASVTGEIRLLDARGQLLERRPIPPPIRGPAADLTVTLPDRSGSYTLEARATLGKFTAEARADLYAESVCKPLMLPQHDLGTLDGMRLFASVPVVTDSSYRCDYLVTVSDLRQSNGQVVPLNLAKQADVTRANEGAADPGPKCTVEAEDVLGAHAVARLQGPGQVALVAGRGTWPSQLAPGLYKATLTVALKHTPQRRSSTTLTLRVPEPPPREPSTPPPEVASREQRDAELAQLRRQLEAERRTRAEERREAERRASSAENALAEQATRQLYFVITLIALTPLACFGCASVWKWIWESSEEPPPRRAARAAVSPPRATAPEDDRLPTFDDFPEEAGGQFEAPRTGNRTSYQSFGG